MPAGDRLAQLPPARATFTGREGHLDQLDRELAAGTTVVIVDGAGGAGKTALAAHWGHRVRERFPDGQLYVDLHGFGPTQPVDPRTVLDDWLRLLGADAGRVPGTLEACTAMYRGLLAGREILIFLDNARSADQVRPLLPSGPGCFVVVTSRDQLRGLAALDGARRIGVGPLEPDEATALLSRSIGADRVDLEPAAAAAIVDRCGRLPLAVNIAGDRAVRDHGLASLADLAAELEDVSARLDVLDARDGDPATSVRGVCSWSYDALDDAAARMFRALAVHPGTDFDVLDAAALADLDESVAHPLLDRLTTGHLLERTSAGRWAFHDLLREYAAELADGIDGPVAGSAAIGRLLDRYLAEIVAIPNVPDGGLDSAWLGARRANVVAAARRAIEIGRADFAVAVSSALGSHLDAGGYHHEALLLHGLAIDADDPAESGAAHRRVGIACDRLGRSHDALVHFQRALEVAAACGDAFGEQRARFTVGIGHWRLGEYDRATTELVRCLDLARVADDRHLVAAVLGSLGLVRSALGDYAAAIELHTEAAAIGQELGNPVPQANEIDELGCAYRLTGRYAEAEAHHVRAVEVYRSAGSVEGEADALTHLGLAVAELGRIAEAIGHHERALDLARDLDSPRVIAKALNGLAEARLRSGSRAAAVVLHEQALAVLADVWAPIESARAHDGLGHALLDLDRAPEAVEHWRAALAAYERMRAPQVAAVRQRIAAAATR
ncbi:MAG TPA: tetratricopeptide repeat protein [Pseudonocardiaceae bacterium]